MLALLAAPTCRPEDIARYLSGETEPDDAGPETLLVHSTKAGITTATIVAVPASADVATVLLDLDPPLSRLELQALLGPPRPSRGIHGLAGLRFDPDLHGTRPVVVYTDQHGETVTSMTLRRDPPEE